MNGNNEYDVYGISMFSRIYMLLLWARFVRIGSSFLLIVCYSRQRSFIFYQWLQQGWCRGLKSTIMTYPASVTSWTVVPLCTNQSLKDCGRNFQASSEFARVSHDTHVHLNYDTPRDSYKEVWNYYATFLQEDGNFALQALVCARRVAASSVLSPKTRSWVALVHCSQTWRPE